ncbi:hypothetical protein Hanom_Chr13g01202051 [Helianthus anomalus]
MVTTLGLWKDRFFWVLESIVPFKMIWRHPDAIHNELEPSEDELDIWFLKSVRACPSRLRPFPEPLLVLMGISTLWDKPGCYHVLMRDVMSAMDFLKSDDTSDVVFADAGSTEDKNDVVRGVEHRFEGSGYVNDMEVLDGGKKCELPLVAGKDAKAAGKKVGGSKAIESSSNIDQGEIYVPDWKVTVSDIFKSPTVCEDVLNHFSPPIVRASLSSMVDDEMISKLIMASCNFCSLILEGIARFQKWMQEYEAFSKKRETMKASIATLKKDKEGHKDEIGELQQQAEASTKEKNELEASLEKLAKDNKWLIEHGFQQVVTYLLHSSEFNSALGDVYSKLLIHGRHQGYTTEYDAGVARSPKVKSPLFQPRAFDVFKNTVIKMERLTYLFVCEVTKCYGKPLSFCMAWNPEA